MRRLIPQSEVMVYALHLTNFDRGSPMKTLLAAIVLATLAACGVETATTAAAVAEAKRREVEQAKKNLDIAKQKIEAANQQVQKSVERAEDATKN